jgi:hypothetical protein
VRDLLREHDGEDFGDDQCPGPSDRPGRRLSRAVWTLGFCGRTLCAMGKPLLCRLGRHEWHREHNDEGQSYLVCERCGKYRDTMTLTDNLGPS